MTALEYRIISEANKKLHQVGIGCNRISHGINSKPELPWLIQFTNKLTTMQDNDIHLFINTDHLQKQHYKILQYNGLMK